MTLYIVLLVSSHMWKRDKVISDTRSQPKDKHYKNQQLFKFLSKIFQLNKKQYFLLLIIHDQMEDIVAKEENVF